MSFDSASDEIIMSLAGYMAVKILLEKEPYGADKDIHKAFGIAKDLVQSSGIKGLANVNYPDLDLYRSDMTRDRQSEEIYQYIEEMQNKVQELLVGNRAFLERVVRTLLEKGYILKTEIASVKKYRNGSLSERNNGGIYVC